MKKINKNQGITLIALVITIIVMLILVGVSISMAVNGGLFNYAGKATVDTKNAMKNEQDLINSIIDIYIKPNTMKSYEDTEKDETTGGILKANAKYESDGLTAVIPKGFKVSEKEDETSIKDGVVIVDKDGNEFVWIPVEVVKNGENADSKTSIASFYRSDWSENKRGEEKYTATEGSSYIEPLISGGYTNEETEYNDMLASVYTYGGFYIGRYEAGTTVARTDKSNGTTPMVVKRDVYPYIYVGWGPTIGDYTGNVIYKDKDQGLGALALSKDMYANKDVGVTSTLCYGVMWDAMLDFIKDDSHNVTNSKIWGNYYNNTGDTWKITRASAKWTTTPESDEKWTTVGKNEKKKDSSSFILLTTGANDKFKVKNIYDVGGNVYEWTNEASSTGDRVRRGGSYNVGGSRTFII